MSIKSTFNPARLVGKFLNGLARIVPETAGRLAFKLFCMPRPKRPKPVEAAFLATADLFFETVAGQKIAVYHWGFRGPVVLLAHGWESHAGRWRKIAPLLVQAGYQVVALDAPAHGRSQGRSFTMIKYADVLRALMQRLGPIDTVIGHSVGGAAAIWAMGTGGTAVRPRKAVIMCSFSALQYIMDGAYKMVGASPRLIREVNNYVIRWSGLPVAHFSIARMAAQLEDVEGLLIHDRQDRVTAFSESEILHQAWPKAQFLPTEGFGHGLTAPQVTDAMMDFVRKEAYVDQV